MDFLIYIVVVINKQFLQSYFNISSRNITLYSKCEIYFYEKFVDFTLLVTPWICTFYETLTQFTKFLYFLPCETILFSPCKYEENIQKVFGEKVCKIFSYFYVIWNLTLGLIFENIFKIFKTFMMHFYIRKLSAFHEYFMSSVLFFSIS